MTDLWELQGSLYLCNTLPVIETCKKLSAPSEENSRIVVPESRDDSLTPHLRKRFGKGLHNGGTHSSRLTNRAKSFFLNTKTKASVSSLPEEELCYGNDILDYSCDEASSCNTEACHAMWEPSHIKSSPKIFKARAILHTSAQMGKNLKEKLGLKRNRASSETDMQHQKTSANSSVVVRRRNRSPTRLNRHLSEVSTDFDADSMRLDINDSMIQSYMSSMVSVCESTVYGAGEEVQPRTGLVSVFNKMFDTLQRHSETAQSDKIKCEEISQWIIQKDDFEKWMVPMKRGKDVQHNKILSTSRRYKVPGHVAPTYCDIVFNSMEVNRMESDSFAVFCEFRHYNLENKFAFLDEEDDSENMELSSPSETTLLDTELRCSPLCDKEHLNREIRSSMRLSVVEQLERLEEQFQRTSSLRGSSRGSHILKSSNDFSRKGSLKKEDASSDKRRSLSNWLLQNSLTTLNASFKKKPFFAPIALAEKSIESLDEPLDSNNFIKIQAEPIREYQTQQPICMTPVTSYSTQTKSVSPLPPRPVPLRKVSNPINTCSVLPEPMYVPPEPLYSPVIDQRCEVKSSTLPRKFQERVHIKDILPDKHNLSTYSPSSTHLSKRNTPQSNESKETGEIFFKSPQPVTVVAAVANVFPSAHIPQRFSPLTNSSDQHVVGMAYNSDEMSYSTNTMGRHRPLRSNFRLDHCGTHSASTKLSSQRPLNVIRLE